MADIVAAAQGIAFAATLAVVSAEDARKLRVPDRAIAAGLILSVAFSTGLRVTLLGGFAGFALFSLVWAVRPEGLGGGDIKLGIYLGAVLGPWRVWTAVAIAAVSALIVFSVALFMGRVQRRSLLPFAPFLALGGLLSWNLSGAIPFAGGLFSR